GGDCTYELEYISYSFRRYEFKSTLSQREFSWRSARLLVSFWNGRGAGDFRCRARVWFAHLSHSLLRADRDSPAADAQERPAPLQQQCAFSSRRGAARPRNRVYPGGNRRALLRVAARHAGDDT